MALGQRMEFPCTENLLCAHFAASVPNRDQHGAVIEETLPLLNIDSAPATESWLFIRMRALFLRVCGWIRGYSEPQSKVKHLENLPQNVQRINFDQAS